MNSKYSNTQIRMMKKSLGVYFDKKLNFNYHFSRIFQRVSQKLHALAKVFKYLSSKQKLTIMNAYIYFQFFYCSLIWMCHSRANNTRINKIHERSLRIVYKDEISGPCVWLSIKEICKYSE